VKRRINIESVQQTFDLIIIGGGITGAGILLEAATRGYKCLLLEKGDFASGTSSKSAKLIHGGIRYLKYGKLGLIKESLDERNYLLKTFPHLVKPLPFLFPVYDSTFKYRVGMAIYHFLSSEETLPEYRYIEPDEIKRMFPAINPEGLKGGFIYYDAVTNDARLCNEVMDEAQKLTGNHAVNYCEVISMEKREKVITLKSRDHIENRDIEFKARCIVNATGVWTDEVLTRIASKQTAFTAPSKGIHFVIPKKRFPVDSAVIIPSYAGDNRLNYSIPWENDSVIIGTTDTDYKGNIENPVSQQEDIEYLLSSLKKFAPSLNITQSDILHVYSGLRPMYNDSAPSYERSRDYRIWWEGENILNILGGKFTSYHSMAEALVDELAEKFPSEFIKARLTPGSEKSSFIDLPRTFADNIHERFLEKAPEIFSIARENKNNTELLHPDFNATVAEMIYYIRKMQCYHLNDLMSRRLSLTYVINGCREKESLITKVAELMKAECGWTDEELQNEIQEYSDILKTSPRPPLRAEEPKRLTSNI